MKSQSIKLLNLAVLFFIFLYSCKKSEEAQLPSVTFKKTSGYVYSDAEFAKNQVITVGISADKNKADLMTLRVYYAYGSDPYSVKNSISVPGAQKDHFERDYSITTQNDIGFEKWKFEISDRLGNTREIILRLTTR